MKIFIVLLMLLHLAPALSESSEEQDTNCIKSLCNKKCQRAGAQGGQCEKVAILNPNGKSVRWTKKCQCYGVSSTTTHTTTETTPVPSTTATTQPTTTPTTEATTVITTEATTVATTEAITTTSQDTTTNGNSQFGDK